MKTCSKCLIEKEYSEYFKCRKSKTGYQSQCKECKLVSVKNSPSSRPEIKRIFEKSPARRDYKREYHHKTKLSRNISRRMRQSLNGIRKSVTWESLVEYTLQELRSHLESLFEEGMSWENYGDLWHIDHIVPISNFDITSTSCLEFKCCWRLENLQPLFVIDNLRKSNSL